MDEEKYIENDVGYRIIRSNILDDRPYECGGGFTFPFDFEGERYNITFGELQSKSFEEVLVWVKLVRTKLHELWGLGQRPYVGKSIGEVYHNFSRLKEYPIDDLLVEDELYPEYIGFIKNFSKMGSGVNQFFDGILESRIHGKSIFDYLDKSELFDEFKYTIVQKVRFDKMYMFSKYLENDGKFNQTFYDDLGDFNRTKNNMTIEPKDEGYFELFYDEVICKSNSEDKDERLEAMEKYNEFDRIGFWFEDYDFNQQNKKRQRLKLSSSFVEKFLKTKPVGYLGDNREGFNIKGDEKYFTVRIYNMDKKVFPELFQTLRVGLNQVAVNFNPLTARWIYEKYLGRLETQSKYKVYDPCAGWGGRLLGALCSNEPIHYIGTEVNGRNYYSYDELEHHYKRCFYEDRKQAYRYDKEKHITEEGNVIGLDDGNTQEVWFEGSEVIHKNKKFWDKHENTIDLVFTSPPYFDREQYSEDKDQSYLKYPTYDEWLDCYLEQTLQNAYDLLKMDRYCIINISDIKVGSNIIPLEQDTIRRALKVGFEYEGKMGMCMSRMIGLNPTNSKNYWLDRDNYTTYKTEPILIFVKRRNASLEEENIELQLEEINE